MAGAFAHMSAAESVCDSLDFLAAGGRTGEIARYAVEKNLNFCQLGSVSPDLPYLDLPHGNSKGWANVMHYWKTADIIRAGIAYFAGKNLEAADPDTLRALAWLFGYSAHVATDLTIHAVLAASGYPFATKPFQHRYCELQQDAYIYRKTHQMEARDSRPIEQCGLDSCCDAGDWSKVHPAVRDVWLHCLSGVSPADVHMQNGSPGPTSEPTPDVWFHHYTKRLGEFAEQGGGFPIFLHNVLVEEGMTLPRSQDVQMKYIEELKTPTGESVHYDKVFSMTLDNIRATWQQLAAALAASGQTSFALKNADLDTGKADDTGNQIFFA